MKLILSLIVCLVIGAAGCASNPNSLIYQANNRTTVYNEAATALANYKAAPTGDGPEREVVLAKIEDLRLLTARFNANQLYRYSNEMRGHHTATAFGFAEAALAKGQLDDAEQMYRDLIEFYVGASYSGIRDRVVSKNSAEDKPAEE